MSNAKPKLVKATLTLSSNVELSKVIAQIQTLIQGSKMCDRIELHVHTDNAGPDDQSVAAELL